MREWFLFSEHRNSRHARPQTSLVVSSWYNSSSILSLLHPWLFRRMNHSPVSVPPEMVDTALTWSSSGVPSWVFRWFRYDSTPK